MDNIKDIIKSLPSTRKDVDWNNRISIQLPDVKGESSLVSLFSKEEVKKWIEDFKQEYGEDPKFKQEGNKLKVTNPKFVELQQQRSQSHQDYIDTLRKSDNKNLDENTKMKKSELKKQIKEEILNSLEENSQEMEGSEEETTDNLDESWESSWSSFLNEKKKPKKKKKDDEEAEGESPVDDIGLDDIGASPSPEGSPAINTSDVDPNIKAVQDALTQTQAAAEKLKDDKLSHQVGNLITFFTRKYVSKNDNVPATNQ